MAHVETLLPVVEEPARHNEWIAAATGVTVCNFAVILKGWAATETTGSATAAVDIYDEPGHTGLPVIPVRLAAGESAEAWYGPDGILFKNGVHFNVSSGAARGSVFYRRAHT